MKYKIAELVVNFDPKYDILKARAKKYLTSDMEKQNYSVTINKEHIKKMKDKNHGMDSESAEYMIMGNTFYKNLLHYQGCLLHSSAVVVDGEAYLFSADCGTGKSTHTSLWLKYLKDKNPYILNDDKPAIRILDDGIYAYGTPFSGKNDISENKKVKLKAICFIEQSKINFIRKVESEEAISLFLQQTITQLNEKEMLKLLDILDIIITKIPIYKLYCDMSEDAVQLSYKAMRGENTNEN